MKLLTLIGAGVLAGYCYKKMKYKKDSSNNAAPQNEQVDSQAPNPVE
ncbi:hypothetical protein EGK58_008210 [Acinetobacter variabilis]|uniref:Uncharacterized protein n=1 Tax=Acinetobacter variabilis TaxID=70346 RepID=A0A8F6QSW5_9GAMM|nr:hypothetical protein [Acinetobacter variabilis]QXR18117.1 hypothetical protein EGK58_008210 [Acinetobacter variabilis]